MDTRGNACWFSDTFVKVPGNQLVSFWFQQLSVTPVSPGKRRKRNIKKSDCDGDDLDIWPFTGNDMRMILGRGKEMKKGIDIVDIKSNVLHKY